MKNFKKTILLFAFATSSIFIWAQSGTSYGIKAGLNYNSNGSLISESENIIVNSDSNAGYHFGVFVTTKGKIYIRPELVFTHTKNRCSYFSWIKNYWTIKPFYWTIISVYY